MAENELPPISSPEIEGMSITELRAEHVRLTHAMQSGVASCLALVERRADGPFAAECESKHLRVGINVALADAGALARLLVAKGVITPLEYYRAIVMGMREEVAGYELALSQYHGAKITLG